MKKLNKKGEIDIRSYLIVFLIVTGLAVTFNGLVLDSVANYASISDIEEDAAFVSNFDQINSISTEVEDIETTLAGTDTGDTDSQTQFFGGALSSLKITIQSFSLTKNMLNYVSDKIAVPPIWIQVAVTGLTLAILATILFMIFKHTGK